ncbi:MAG: sugar phosphate isomerase/epimerase [Alistipes sp.]|jgi:sugar phosphate isomerase/epimerase|nr:sugar phosphate isomerase/epimerase [Alistipes sp.]
MKTLSRRSFLAASAAGAATLAMPGISRAGSLSDIISGAAPSGAGQAPAAGSVAGRPKLCLSTYSLQNLARDPQGIEKVINYAADWGIDGVDILHRSLASEDNAYIQSVKQLAYKNGVMLACLSIDNDFVDPRPEFRQAQVNNVIRYVELAARMGIPAIRLNSGGWGTAARGSSLIERAQEGPMEGYTHDDGFAWIQDCIYKCLPAAEQNGVVMLLENHWGLSTTAERMLRIKNSVKSQWLSLLLDTANFAAEHYESIEKLLPESTFISCKTYQGGGFWMDFELDYERIFKMFHDANYRGYITLEFEGRGDRIPSSIESLTLFKRLIDKYYTNYPVK